MVHSYNGVLFSNKNKCVVKIEKASMNLKHIFKWQIQFIEIIYYRNPATLHSGKGKTDNRKISDSQKFAKENEEWIDKTSENFREGKLFCLIM